MVNSILGRLATFFAPGHPHSLGGSVAERNRTRICAEGKRLIVIPPDNLNSRSRTYTAMFKKFQQAPVALVDTTHYVSFSWCRLGQQDKATSPSALRAFQFAQIPVRTRAATPQPG